jgi:hypothetical protein
MDLTMKELYYLLDNSVVFYGVFTITMGLIGYSFATSYFNPVYSDKIDNNVQTDA